MRSSRATTEYLAVSAVATRLGVTGDTVLAWLHGGGLPGINVARKVGAKPRWRISTLALEDFLATRRSTPVATPSRRRRRKLAQVTQYF